MCEPDWLKEPRGWHVQPDTRWYPFLTFFQVIVDQFFGTTVPYGHGHNYGNTIVSAWIAVVPAPSWTPEQLLGLQQMSDGLPIE